MFYVDHNVMMRLSGRTKKDLYKVRTSGELPYFSPDERKMLYDVDDPKVQRYIVNVPDSWSRNKLAPMKAYREEFQRRRNTGEIVCQRYGTVDHMASIDPEIPTSMLDSFDDTELDREKKRKEIEYKEMQIEKGKVALMALSGDLIDRVYVEAYVRRYLGAMHQQILNSASTGIMDDLYSLFRREEDGVKAMKDGQKLLESKLSDIIKGAISAMDTNRL